MKGPTEYRPASNTYPVKTLQRDVDDRLMHLALQSWLKVCNLIFDLRTNRAWYRLVRERRPNERNFILSR